MKADHVLGDVRMVVVAVVVLEPATHVVGALRGKFSCANFTNSWHGIGRWRGKSG